ncbi:MAG: hypothetical protein ACYDBB_00125 [Armatimonadota bacterium]
MRRHLSLLLLLCAVLVPAWAKTPEFGVFPGDTCDNRQRVQLLGPVRTLTTSVAPLLPGNNNTWLEGKKVTLLTLTFDQYGNRLAEVGYQQDGTRSWRFSFTYDSAGRKNIALAYGDITAKVGTKFLFSYDLQGHLAEQIGYNDEGSRSFKRTLAYDLHGNPETDISYAAVVTGGWRINLRRSYEYDGNGNLIAESVEDLGSERTMKTLYTYQGVVVATAIEEADDNTLWQRNYDPRGHLTERIHTNRIGGVLSREVFTYNTLGHETEMCTYKGDGTLAEKRVTTYNAAGVATDISVFGSEGRLSRRTQCVYNQAKQKTEERLEVFLTATYSLQSKTFYQYDTHGNWIRQTIESRKSSELQGIPPSSVTYRQINYY